MPEPEAARLKPRETLIRDACPGDSSGCQEN